MTEQIDVVQALPLKNSRSDMLHNSFFVQHAVKAKNLNKPGGALTPEVLQPVTAAHNARFLPGCSGISVPAVPQPSLSWVVAC